MKKLFVILFATMFLFTGCESDKKETQKNSTQSQNEKVVETLKTPAVTLKVNPTDFQQRFNSSASDLGFAGAFDLGTPQIKSESYGDSARYKYNENLELTEHIDKDSGNIEIITIFVSLGENRNVENFKNNMADAMIIYPAAIISVSPNLTDSEVGTILTNLGLTRPISEWAMSDTSTNYNGVVYSKKIIRGRGISFVISAK